jgi:hypothetical protein
MIAEMGLGEPVTIQELEATREAYEGRYRMPTSEFLRRFENPLDTLEGIDDADLWFQTHCFLERLREEQNAAVPPWLHGAAEEPTGDPKGSSFVSMRYVGDRLDARGIHREGYGVHTLVA